MADGCPFRFFDLEERTLLITGTTRGIGKALLPGLLEQGLNLVLIGLDMSAMKTIRDALDIPPERMHLYECDLADTAAVDATANEIADSGITLDGMLHNAAIDPRHRFEDKNGALWQEVWQINFQAAVTLTQCLLPSLRRSDQGRVIFTSSVMFEFGGNYLSAYVASKGAVEGLTRSLAHELKGTNITVNCIAPGAIRVEKERGGAEADQRLIGWQTVGRRLEPTDLLGPICLLLSRAGGGISGQTLTVDGGLLHPIADSAIQGRRLSQI